jgi:phage gp36-like protein
MSFLTKNDFTSKITSSVLNQITGSDDTLLIDAENKAAAVITDMLQGNYNIAVELSKTGNGRHQALLGWMLYLAVYFLYERIPDSELPDRVVKNYDDTMYMLRQIARGKTPTSLTPRTVDGKAKRTFRMGSTTPRSHEVL